MSRSVVLAPSILAADFGRLTEQVQELDRAGDVDRIHVDIMDGMFVPNISFGPEIVHVIRRATQLPLDVHLMIVEPARYYEAFKESGADFLTVHVEACPHLNRDLTEIKRLGCRAGVALNPATSPVLIDSALDATDVVLVMSVNPGFGGQKFIPSSLEKIARIRGMLTAVGSQAEISVDGGVGPGTAGSVVRAGATVLVAGSAVFRNPRGVKEAIRELRVATAQVEM